MKYIVHVIITLSIKFVQKSESLEHVKEKALLDSRGRDKFFDYAEFAEPKIYNYKHDSGDSVNNYSSNLDLDLFVAANPQAENLSIDNQKKPSSNVISFFLNAIKKVINPEHHNHAHRHSEKETYKGLDIKLDSNTHLLPNLGNDQDIKFTLIGTKWCGAGDSARNKNDIGYFYLTDNCCREHDLCPMVLAAQESKYGLKNSGKFTRSHCDCDQKFYKCLKQVNTMLSNQIGNFYFNVLGHQCFKEDFPFVTCKSFTKSRCITYNTDSTQQKSFQWFDNPWF